MGNRQNENNNNSVANADVMQEYNPYSDKSNNIQNNDIDNSEDIVDVFDL